MITFKRALEIHAILIDRFGGSSGVRDYSLLESALNRPYLSFRSNKLYPTSADKAAAILDSIIKTYPFADGNERTAYVLARLILLADHRDVVASREEKQHFIQQVAAGDLALGQIRKWLLEHTYLSK